MGPVLALDDLLDDPLLEGSRCLTDPADLGRHEIRWFSVIERPVEDFVQRDDLVMTTGLGCDAAQFSELIRQVAESAPAGIFVALPEQSPLRSVPADAIEIAAAAGVPLVEIPWRVRFAEIARTIVDRLTFESRGAQEAQLVGVGPGFIAALLDEQGVEALAGIAESLLSGPVVVLGADLRVEAAGPLARERFAAELEDSGCRADALGTADVLMVRSMLENPSAVDGGLERLGLPQGMVVPAGSMRRSGYVLAPDGDIPVEETPADEQQRRELLEQAAQACALEQVRARAIAESAVRAQGDLLWAIARGDVEHPDEIGRRAALLGYRREARHSIGFGLLSSGPSAANDAVTLDAVTLPRLRRQGVQASRSDDGVLLVIQADAPQLRRLLADAPGATWGVADDAVALQELRSAYVRAQDTAAAAIALGRRGTVSAEADVHPYLLLTRLRKDAACERVVGGLLGPLIAYDERTSRALLRTLEVYLATNGNTSAAARTLHLNRHSLLYRLRKIETLTGCDLTDHDDRFLLDLVLRLRRIGLAGEDGERAGRAQPPSAPG